MAVLVNDGITAVERGLRVQGVKLDLAASHEISTLSLRDKRRRQASPFQIVQASANALEVGGAAFSPGDG
jgi:hypothetical protein